MQLKTFSLIFLFIAVNIFSQPLSRQMSKAMKEFDNGNYSVSYNLFQKISGSEKLNVEQKATADYYIARSLFKMKELDGAIARYEGHIEEYEISELRDNALFDLGRCYFKKGEYYNCRTTLVQLNRKYPESEFIGNSNYWIAEAYEKENKNLDAEKYYLEAISNSSTNDLMDNTIYSLANLYEKIEGYESAVTYYDELLSYYRESELAPYAALRIGISYFQLGEYESAVLELTDKIVNKLPFEQQVEAQTMLANSFSRLEKYEDAADSYEKILEKADNQNVANQMRYGLAWVNFQIENYQQAYKIFNLLSKSEIDTIATNSFYWSAECMRYQGEYDEALQLYNDFLSEYPENKLASRVRFNIGIIHYNNKEVPKAERFLIAAVNSNESTSKAKAFTLLGEISLHKDDYESAGNYFTSAMQLPGITTESRNRSILGLGISQYYRGMYQQAIMNLSDLAARHKEFEINKVQFYLAESYFERVKYSEALKHYSSVNIKDGEVGSKALYGKAYCFFNMKDYANASFYFKDYVQRFSGSKNYLDAKLRLADSYYGTKNFSKASTTYGELFSKDKAFLNNQYANYQYGQALFHANEYEDAIRQFKGLQNRFPNSKYSDDSQYLIGWINFQRNRYENAITEYKKVFSKYPNSGIKPIVYYSIGDSYFNIGKYDTALTYYRQLIYEYPRTKHAYDGINGIQYVYIAKDQPDKAVNTINQFIANNPTVEFGDQVLYKKGEIYYSVGEYEKARVGYKEFIATYRNSDLVPNAYYWIGKSSEIIGNIEDAKFNYQKVLDNYLNSDVGLSAVLELAKFYERDEEFGRAIDLYNRAIEGVKESKKIAELKFNKAEALVKKEELQTAYETFDELIKYYDGILFADKAKLELGKLELERKGYDNAERFFKELSENRTDDIGAEAQYMYGVALYEQKQLGEAISAFVRVRSIFERFDEWYTKSLLKLGDIYTQQKNYSNAREMYRAVVKRHPNDDYGKEARKKLGRL